MGLGKTAQLRSFEIYTAQNSSLLLMFRDNLLVPFAMVLFSCVPNILMLITYLQKYHLIQGLSS